MQKKIKRKIEQIEKKNEKLRQKMKDREEVYGLDGIWDWYEIQTQGNEMLIEFYREELEQRWSD